jgi:hypothetical protein
VFNLLGLLKIGGVGVSLFVIAIGVDDGSVDDVGGGL